MNSEFQEMRNISGGWGTGVREEAFVWSCRESCEKPLMSSKGVTESDLPFRSYPGGQGGQLKGVKP